MVQADGLRVVRQRTEKIFPRSKLACAAPKNNSLLTNKIGTYGTADKNTNKKTRPKNTGELIGNGAKNKNE